MSEGWPRSRLADQAEAALRRLAAADAVADADQDAAPAPGDIFVAACTAEQAVEWVLIERDDTDAERVTVVPADTGSLIGSADLAIADDAPEGPLTLRCGHAVKIHRGVFDLELRTGRLGPERLAAAQEALKSQSAGRALAGGDALEAELDPEYRHWHDQVVASACASIVAVSNAIASQQPADPALVEETVVAFPTRRSWQRPLALAASILLVVSLGLTAGLLHQRGRLATLAADLQSQAEERSRLEAAHRQRLAALVDERALEATAHQAAIEALTSRLEAAMKTHALPPLVGLMKAWLVPGARRGEAQRIEVPTSSDPILLMLQQQGSNALTAERLEILDPYADRVVWRGNVVSHGDTEVAVLLPRSLLRAGEYRLDLIGQRDGVEAVVHYPIELVFAPQ